MKRKVALDIVGGMEIFTAWAEPDESTDKLVIMAHGFRGTSVGAARTFVNFERELLQDGFACLRFDQPGSGNSSGDFADVPFSRWVDTIAELATSYLGRGYRVALLGQSMGATATMVAAAKPSLRDRIPCVLLWVPDPKSTDDVEAYGDEEGGQRFSPHFWPEARDADFLGCLTAFPGGVHLVYGEHDEYVSPALRDEVMAIVRRRGDEVLVLPGQGHSSWGFRVAESVYAEHRRFLAGYFLSADRGTAHDQSR